MPKRNVKSDKNTRRNVQKYSVNVRRVARGGLALGASVNLR